MARTSVNVAGGGLAGLAAALAVVRRGSRARVLERRRDVGARFHGDFQGLENRSTEGDVLEELASVRRDAAVGAVSDELVPAGYAYLLLCRGRATLATCMFGDFHHDKQYLARCVDFFERKVGITLRDARPFGEFGNMAAEPTVRRGGLLLAGEAAGLQDALFGFGMRYALTSGCLAVTCPSSSCADA